MASSKNTLPCHDCAETGLLCAFLVKQEETGEKKIVVKLCKGHFNQNLAENTLANMKKNTSLPIEVG